MTKKEIIIALIASLAMGIGIALTMLLEPQEKTSDSFKNSVIR